MPTKQTKEEIEAELNASERERLIQKFREIIRDWDEFEKDLQQLEAEAGLPTFYRSKSVPDRMAAVGLSQKAIEHVTSWMDTMVKINSGRMDELPADLKKELAKNCGRRIDGCRVAGRYSSEPPEGLTAPTATLSRAASLQCRAARSWMVPVLQTAQTPIAISI